MAGHGRHLFPERERLWKSDGCHGGEFSARRPFHRSLKRGHGRQCVAGQSRSHVGGGFGGLGLGRGLCNLVCCAARFKIHKCSDHPVERSCHCCCRRRRFSRGDNHASAAAEFCGDSWGHCSCHNVKEVELMANYLALIGIERHHARPRQPG